MQVLSRLPPKSQILTLMLEKYKKSAGKHSKHLFYLILLILSKKCWPWLYIFPFSKFVIVYSSTLNPSKSSFNSGSSELTRIIVLLMFHFSSGFQRNFGPRNNYLTLLWLHMSMPLEAWSAGFCFEWMINHWHMSEFSLISSVLLATNIFNLLTSFLMYARATSLLVL